MSTMQLTQLPLPDVIPDVVSNDAHLLTAWQSIKAWFQKIVDGEGEMRVFLTNACFIMMACKFANLRIQKLATDASARTKPGLRLHAAFVIRKMQDVSAELGSFQAMNDWLGNDNTLQATVKVGNNLYNGLYQSRGQYGANQPIAKGTLLSVQRIWTMISLFIGIQPDPSTINSKEVKTRLAWLQKQLDEPVKRPYEETSGQKGSAKKAKTASSEVIKRIEVVDPQDLDVIKRYDINIGIVPTEGPVKNRSVVTAYDLLTLAQGELVNDAVIDAHLTLLCHSFNNLFQEGINLPRSPTYHAWSVQMSMYLRGRIPTFEERHLRQEWPPARFPHAVLQDIPCHIFPIHVEGGKGHWVLMVLQKAPDAEWTLYCYSSLPGYNKAFQEPWQVISSWLLFKSKGDFNVTSPRVEIPIPQPSQDNVSDCGVFVCAIVRWSLERWDLSTLSPSIIPEYRRRMILELERWSLSTNKI